MTAILDTHTGDATEMDVTESAEVRPVSASPVALLPLTVVSGPGGGPCMHPKNCGWPTCAC